MRTDHVNPYQPPLQDGAALSQEHRAPSTMIPFVSGAVYATLCLGIFLALEYIAPVLPVALILLLIVIQAPFYIASMVMLLIGRNGNFECPAAGWIAAFLVATMTHHLLSKFRLRASKRG